MNSTPTAVIGLNPRGAALAAALAKAGNPVTVWDHAEKPLIDEKLPRASSLESMLAAASLVILCVEDYEVARRILDQAGPQLGTHDLVNLTSGTSADAQQAADWMAARGGRYLDGALMAHPEHVGNPDTVLVYSGSAEVFERGETVLRQLGSATYLGADAGIAALYDLAMLNFAWATLTGFLQTTALLGTAGVEAGTITPLLTHWLTTTVAEVIRDYAGQIDGRDYPGDEEWLELDAPLMAHLVRATAESGLDTRLPELVRSLTADGIDAGHGRDSFASLIEIIRHRQNLAGHPPLIDGSMRKKPRMPPSQNLAGHLPPSQHN
ncbi:NAD(P)-dependent oxidoreductase [Amycolatopsis nigrescens]|uniref:NAD(P)-dependent oxidoreductase n=1 Tax=Amycolatopsis nigrescens TaxID=381445 RepID=UPI0003760FC5|nr:NAD(P)-binding domain-containing protein [Amycolatopsis nigrescens]